MNLGPSVPYAPTGGFEPLLQSEPPGANLLDQLFRQLACVGTAGVVAMGALNLEQIGTNLLALVAPAAEGGGQLASQREALAVSVAEQVRELLASLALNKSLLAEVLNVSRPTLYDWFDGKEPNAANAERLATLLRLVSRAGVSGSHPLSARFVRRAMREDDPPLLDLLRAEALDEVHIAGMLREARLLTDHADEIRRDREQRLRAAGYEELTDEQRKEILAQNTGLRDWPKT